MSCISMPLESQTEGRATDLSQYPINNEDCEDGEDGEEMIPETQNPESQIGASATPPRAYKPQQSLPTSTATVSPQQPLPTSTATASPQQPLPTSTATASLMQQLPTSQTRNARDVATTMSDFSQTQLLPKSQTHNARGGATTRIAYSQTLPLPESQTRHARAGATTPIDNTETPLLHKGRGAASSSTSRPNHPTVTVTGSKRSHDEDDTQDQGKPQKPCIFSFYLNVAEKGDNIQTEVIARSDIVGCVLCLAWFVLGMCLVC